MLQPSDEAKKLLSPEELEALQEALADFERDIASSNEKAEPMPPGKADFPPLLCSGETGENDQPVEEPLR